MKLNFLEGHYIQAMEVGIDHAVYCVYNDLPKDIADKLKDAYERWQTYKYYGEPVE